jgi:hypothetical protein
MPDTHVLTQPNLNKFKLVRHVVIPVGNNSAGVSWQLCLINSRIGGNSVLMDGNGTGGTISAAEKALIANGSLYEVVEDNATMPADLTPSQQLAYLDETYTNVAAATLSSLQQLLKYFGFTRDTPGQGQ